MEFHRKIPTRMQSRKTWKRNETATDKQISLLPYAKTNVGDRRINALLYNEIQGAQKKKTKKEEGRGYIHRLLARIYLYHL